ncbi:hypothetical protein Pfo_020854 [Paulownia fortunei]|nr:hypothetical protein Pfo_020854 [Paulownia fortunei]
MPSFKIFNNTCKRFKSVAGNAFINPINKTICKHNNGGDEETAGVYFSHSPTATSPPPIFFQTHTHCLLSSLSEVPFLHAHICITVCARVHLCLCGALIVLVELHRDLPDFVGLPGFVRQFFLKLEYNFHVLFVIIPIYNVDYCCSVKVCAFYDVN